METFFDNHGRQINYLRLAVTDRCNLRCFYCMPEKGIQYVPRKELLSYEEMLRLVGLLTTMGIEKVRITGGEPFLRKGMMDFLSRLKQIDGLKKLHITTNGTLTAGLVPQLKDMGIDSVNLSLDTLDRERFHQITRRDDLPKVLQTLDELIKHGIPTKINAVVMEGKNENELIPMTMITKELPVDVRFIEEMPFNGSAGTSSGATWNYVRIFEELERHFPEIEKLPDPPNSTSYNYQVPGHQGKLGIIAAYSRTFCGSCNRLRLTPKGMLKTCLYDHGIFNIKTLMREGATDQQLRETFIHAIGSRAKNGFEAEKRGRLDLSARESMSTIGG